MIKQIEDIIKIVSEGLNSVETCFCHTGKAEVARVSEGLNSVETRRIENGCRCLSCVSEGLNSVETRCWIRDLHKFLGFRRT